MDIAEFMFCNFPIARYFFREVLRTVNRGNLSDEDEQYWKAIADFFATGDKVQFRNCDVYRTRKEMHEAFHDYCRRGCINCPLYDVEQAWRDCEFAWSLMPAEKKRGGQDDDTANPL